MNEVPVQLLKPHPKNEHYYSKPSPEEYEAIKRSIETEGIRDPLKVTPDFTVISGHIRLAVAKELGLEKVPVVIVNGDQDYLEYLLIADNDERRVCRDPIKKARRDKYMLEYWKKRKNMGSQNATPKSVKELAREAGYTGKDEFYRSIKLNDLIPPLQHLVSQGKLSQTAAYSLAFLSVEEQEQLLGTLSESGVCGLTVKEAQELKRELEFLRREKESLTNRLMELEDENLSLSKQIGDIQISLSPSEEGALAELQNKLKKSQEEAEILKLRLKELETNSVEKVIEKVVYRTDPALEAELEAVRKQNAELLKEKEWFESRFRDVAAEKEKKETRLRALESENKRLQKMLDQARKELEKEKSRPKPPQWSKEHLEFQGLMQEASRDAASLATALAHILEKHRTRLLAAARVHGTPGDELGDMIEVVGDALLFRGFDAALKAAASKISEVWDALEPGKPNLHLIKRNPDK
ncbi:MAG: ParB N-terminal domain-containing protein [Thermacetogeniaceae bacterium]